MGIRDLMVTGSKEIFRRIGDPGTYGDASTALPIESYFIVKEAVDILGDLGQVVGRRDEVSVLIEDIPNPIRKGVINCGPIGGTQRTWELVEKIMHDGYYERWAVKHG